MNILHILAALAAPVVATASEADAPRVVVSSAGLDLATSSGVKLLDLRIAHAAASLCGTPSPSDALALKKFKQCRDAAREAAGDQRQAVVARARKGGKEAVASAR